MTERRRPEVDPIEAAFAASRGQRMHQYEIAWLLIAAIRIPTIMNLARARLTRQMFDASEANLLLLWRGASAAADECGGALPADPEAAAQLVELRCATELTNDPQELFYTPAVREHVLKKGGLIDDVISFKPSEEFENRAIGLLARFLRERMLSDPIRRAVAGIGTGVITDTDAVIAVIEQKARELVGLSDDPGSSAVVTGFVPVGRKSVTTKFKFLDKLMNGGHADSEAYAVLGPSSGGKSALMLQIAMEGAQLEAAAAAELALPQARYWYYFTWELTEAQLRTRVYSYGAKVDINSINAYTDTGLQFSTAADMETVKEYEREVYVNSPGNPFMGEKERIAALERRFSDIGNNFVIVDYSGAKPGRGEGGIDEVAAYLKLEATRGRRVAGVVIDYAGLVVNRFINAKNLDPKAEYPLLAGFGNQVRSKIAIPFKCKAWVAHQLHGEAAKKKFAKLHYSDARGCKNFADNFDFGIEFGKYAESTGLVEFTSSKHRHAAAVENGPVARFDGRFGVFLDPSEEYVRDPASGVIVPRSYLNQMPTAGSGRRPAYDAWDGMD